MSFEHEKREARRILEGIENGTMTPHESWALIQDADPTLVYFIITWLRSYYAGSPAADAVVGRVVALVKAYPEVQSMMRTGEADAIVDWFEDAYTYRDFTADQFVDVVVEKLEG
jgi:hypothetical protein